MDDLGSIDTGISVMDFLNTNIVEIIQNGAVADSLKVHGVANNLSIPTNPSDMPF